MEIWLSLYIALMSILGIYGIVNVILNLIYFHIMGKAEKHTDGPLISVVIPARNEEGNIGNLLDSMVSQDYGNIEILVINDQSTDRTGEILEEYRKKDSRIQVFSTDPGRQYHVNGKINALLQLIPHAKGEYILATDADTVHKSDCISFAYSVMKAHSLDIISGFPKELCHSYFGNICMSAMMLTTVFIPQWFIHRFPIPAASFAIGQFIMMKKSAYDETGGYDRIKGEICDDIGIVRLFVRSGKKYSFIDLSKHSACLMYRTAKESFKGIERSIAGVIPPKITMLLPIVIAVVALLHIALSPIAAAMLLLSEGLTTGSATMLAGTVLFIAGWFIGCKAFRWQKRISISCPLTLIVVCAMYIHGLFRSITGKGFEWKGRIIH